MRPSSLCLLLPILASISAPSRAIAAPGDDFHGLLYSCGRHPVVQVSGRVAHAYEADLTHSVEGSARVHGNAVTLSFPQGHAPFTIVRRGSRYLADGKSCQADPV